MSYQPPHLTEYELDELIYSSDRTLVYRGLSRVYSQSVIVKFAKFISDELIADYSHNYQIASNLNFSGIIQPLHFYNWGETVALVMVDENLVSLGNYLKSSSNSSKSEILSLDDFFPIALQITDIINHLYNHGIVHSQLNFDHLLIHPETKQIKLIDFSKAWQFPVRNYGDFSPETTATQTHYNYDLYSLSTIFVQLLTGTTTTPENNLESLQIPGIPKEISELLNKLIAENSLNFYNLASELREDLLWCWQQWQFRDLTQARSIENQQDIVSSSRKWQKYSTVEPTLAQSNNLLQLILDNIPQAIFWKDRNSNYLGCNRKFLEYTGLTSETEIIGKSDYDLPWSKEEADFYRECDRKVMENNVPESYIRETKRTITNRVYWLDTKKFPLRDLSGNVVGVLGTYEDITERTQANIALENQLKRITLLGKITREIHQSLNTQEIFAIATREIRHILQVDRVGILQLFEDSNYTEGKFVAENVVFPYSSALFTNIQDHCFGTDHALDYHLGKIQAIADIYQANFSDCYLETLAKFQIRANLIIPLLQGNKLWGLLCIHQCSHPRHWQEEEITFVQKIATQLNISLYQAELLEKAKKQHQLLEEQNKKLLESKQKAEAANHAKSVFLANMSHELRTPLNAILGFSQLLQRDDFLSTKHQETLNIINRSGEHLLNLINDILEMSKIEAGKIELNYTDCNIYRLLASIEEMLQIKARSKQLDLVFNIDHNLPQFIKIDESKLRQLLINLVGNAIKFTNVGSVNLEILLESTDANNNRLVFIIKDTGIGIAASELETLFDPFIQTTSGIKSQEGTGLGLTISRKFVQLMGGDITIQSQLNVGTTVKFDIKYQKSQRILSNRETKPQVVGLAPNQENYRILIVEDIKENRQLILEILESVGFNVREARNGQQAIWIWQEWQPHLIWMDIQMPIVNGYEAIEQIRKREKRQKNLQSTVIIALTASAFQEEREKILAIGADDFVSKPFAEWTIFEKIQTHLKVDFVWQSESSTTQIQSQNQTILNQQELINVLLSSPIDQDWINKLHFAAIELDEELMIETIEEIAADYQNLAQTLTHWVNNFQFDLIADATEKLIQGYK
ncbi:MAG: ATP-binding protein [Xenococcaceae cyanobacterium MO_188.B19]|nr:ATP-binding protein [Xenococcaceae cyanobacterium MO_188.B19]